MTRRLVNRTFGWMAAGGVLLSAAVGLYAQTPASARELFERARLLEESSRTLDRAVVLYEQVVSLAALDRSLAASAALRIGLVKERQGKPEAKTAFTKVVADYADQPDVAAVARARLVPGAARTRAQQESPRVLVSDMDWTVNSVSSDGRWAIGTSSSGAVALVLKDLETKDSRVLIPGTLGSARSPVLDSTGARIAYASVDATGFSLRWISRTEPSNVRTVSSGRPIVPIAWAPDGLSLLSLLVGGSCGNADGQGSCLGWVSLETGKTSIIKRFNEPALPASVALSPDGGHIAYAIRRTQAPLVESQIHVIDKAGQSDRSVVHIAGTNRDPIWTPDGTRLLFSSNRTGVSAVWSVPMSAGVETGEPQMVRSPLDAKLIGMSRSGSLFYSLYSRPSQSVFIAERGRPDARGLQSFNGEGVAWSPDGGAMAFIKNDGTDQNNSLIIRNLGNGNERQFDHPDHLGVQQVRWSRDGHTLMVNVRAGVGSNQGPSNLHTFDTRTSTFRQVPAAPESPYLRSAVGDISPDGKTLYVGGRSALRQPVRQILAVDVASGTERVVAALPDASGDDLTITVSPDGQKLVVRGIRGQGSSRQPFLALVQIDSGESRDLRVDSKLLLGPSSAAWTPDGQDVLYFAAELPGAWRLMRMPITGAGPIFDGLDRAALTADPKLPPMTVQYPGSLTISPDGSRVGFAAFAGGSRELQVLDNLLAAVGVR